MANGSGTKENILGTEPVLGLIAGFAIPSIISMVVNALYNITDQVFIGHVVGMYGNAATTVAFPTVNLTIALAQLAGVGMSANFSICLGAKQKEKAERFVYTGLSLLISFGLALLLILKLFQGRILLLCGATEQVYPYALAYLSITAFGLPLQMFTNAVSLLIRADGSPRYAMVCNMSGALLNVLLDWLFMFPLKMGIRGAALATVIGQTLSALLSLRHLGRFAAFPLNIRRLRFYPGILKEILKLGLSSCLNHCMMMLTQLTLNNSLGHWGALSVYGEDIPLAVSGVAAKINSILISVSVGLALGCQPIWGFNLGARKYGRVREAYLKACGLAMGVGVVFLLLFEFFPRQLVSIFGSGEELYYQFAERYLRTYLMLVPLMSVQPITTNFFGGTGAVKQGIIMSLSRQGLFLIPTLLILPRFLGIDGVLLSGPICDGLAFLLAIALISVNFRNMKKLETEPAE